MHPWTKPQRDLYSAEEIKQLFSLERSMKRAAVVAWSQEGDDTEGPSVLAWSNENKTTNTSE